MADASIFGPVDGVLAAELGVADVIVIEAIILVLVVANLATRKVANDRHRRQAQQGPESITRFLPHEVLNVSVVLASFFYMTVAHHAGFVMSVLALGVFLSDFFEFEARKVEARRDIPIDQPKGAIVASMLALAYAAFQTLFFIIEGPFNAIV